jgi:hypothetical protein
MSTKPTPSDIFRQAAPAVVADIFSYIHENEKPLYKATIESLATQRKLRPVFVERKPRNERHAWLREALGKKSGDAIAAHLLQIWLVGRHAKLLCDFLDGLGIKHDDNGTIEQLPAQPAKETLEKVIDGLLTKHDPEIVAVYLNAFQALDDTGWTNLDEILQSDERLRLGKTATV